MDISFKQPPGYLLENAQVYVTVSENDTSYATGKPRRASERERHRSGNPTTAAVADHGVSLSHFGPNLLTGTQTVQSESSTLSMIPTVGVMGFELGGMGRESSKTKDRVGQWTFRGNTTRPSDGYGLRTLKWELVENELDHQRLHNQTFKTAFAFEHSNAPVYMRVEVQGRLRSKSDQAKHTVLRFSSKFGNKDTSTLLEIGLGKRPSRFTERLDDLAQGLDMAMQMENYASGPVEMPGPTQVAFGGQSQLSQDGYNSSSYTRVSEEEDRLLIQALLKRLEPQRHNTLPTSNSGEQEGKTTEEDISHTQIAAPAALGQDDNTTALSYPDSNHRLASSSATLLWVIWTYIAWTIRCFRAAQMSLLNSYKLQAMNNVGPSVLYDNGNNRSTNRQDKPRENLHPDPTWTRHGHENSMSDTVSFASSSRTLLNNRGTRGPSRSVKEVA